MTALLTPSQTAGPYLAIGLPWLDGPFVVAEGTPGAITITGAIWDGAGEPVHDALVETWQADPDGRFDHPGDPRGRRRPAESSFRGFGRCLTGPDGSYRIITLKPGRETKGCLCNQLLRGINEPTDCKLFGKACTPLKPVGACMVSTEGACRIWYTYGRGAKLVKE